MSITDPAADDVQPDEGQGSEASGGGSPWESLLTRFPEDVREDAAAAFREQEANANKRFEEHASFRKQWEPLAETGVNQLSPEEVSWLVQFRGALDDPQTMQQWWEGYAQENGLTPAQQAAEQPQTLDDFGSFGDPQQLQSLIDQATGPLKQQLEQMQAHMEQQQQQQSLAEANQFVDRQVAELEQKHGKFDDEDREALALFASKFADSDPMNAIKLGYELMTKFTNRAEKQALQAKVNSPSPAEGGGVPDTSPERFTSLNAPGFNETATEWMRNNRG